MKAIFSKTSPYRPRRFEKFSLGFLVFHTEGFICNKEQTIYHVSHLRRQAQKARSSSSMVLDITIYYCRHLPGWSNLRH